MRHLRLHYSEMGAVASGDWRAANVVRSSSRDSSDMAELMNLLSSSSKVGLCASLSL